MYLGVARGKTGASMKRWQASKTGQAFKEDDWLNGKKASVSG